MTIIEFCLPRKPQMVIRTLTGRAASVLGLAAYPDQNPDCVERAYESGINFFFFYGPGQRPFIEALKPLVSAFRDDIILAGGSGARTATGLRAAHRKIVAATKADILDAFFAEYINPGDDLAAIFGSRGVLDELQRWKADGLIRYVGASAHDRPLAKRLAEDIRVDILMHRFNMAHRKAADEVFPAAKKAGTAVVAFTATRWSTLLKPHPAWPSKPPTAADCYQYCLAEPAVHLVLTAPKSLDELDESLAALKLPPMDEASRRHWETFGDIVYKDGGGPSSDFEDRWP
jgi:aryl-alcohol dehydrogenase-like predicted oxidoreductase